MLSKNKIRERQEFMEKFNGRFQQKCNKVSDILKRLNWSSEHFVKPKKKRVCHFDANHIVPEEKMDTHLKICSLKRNGCTPEEVKDIINSPEFVSPNPHSIRVDEITLNNILWNYHVKSNSVYYGNKSLPATRDRVNSELSCTERGAIYDFVVDKAKQNNQLITTVPDEFLTRDFPKELKKAQRLQDQPKSKIEALIAQRDYKRRRQSYKGKSVHTSKKNYTEIIREVINNQIEEMRETLKDDHSNNSYLND